MNTQWWETETFSQLIHRILDGQISIVDDTLLQKLLTHLECMRLSQDDTRKLLSMLDVSKLLTFLSSDEIDPTALAFGLRLMGILGHEYFHLLQEIKEDVVECLVRDWCRRGRNSECPATIRSAGLQMLLAFIYSEAGLNAVSTTDAVHVALRCLANDSMFVCSDAQNFVSMYITRSMIDDENSACQCAIIALKFLLSKLNLHKNWIGRVANHENKMLLSVLTVFKDICRHNCILTLCPGLTVKLMQLLEQFPENKMLAYKICQVLEVIMVNSGDAELVVKEVLPILMKKSEITVVQKFAALLLTSSCKLSGETTEKLQSLILLPLELTLKKQERPLKEMSSSISSLCQYHKYIQKKDLQVQTLSWLSSILEDASKYYGGFHRSRLQIAALNCIHTLLRSWPNNIEVLYSLSKTIFNIIENECSTSLVLVSAMQVVGVLTNNLIKETARVDQDISMLLKQLGVVINKPLLHDSWEVKDSLLELIATVAPTISASKYVSWITEENIPSEVMTCLQDEESFVRSSGVKTLGILSEIDSVWKNLCTVKSEENVVNEVLLLLHNDTEAIVRRSAVKILSRWHIGSVISNRILYKKIQYAMQRASEDLDWEVKLAVLDFWEEVCKQTLPNFATICSEEVPAYASFLVEEKIVKRCTPQSKEKLLDALRYLNKIGLFRCLMNIADDYDVTVKLQVTLLLRRLKKYFAEFGLVNGHTDRVFFNQEEQLHYPSEVEPNLPCNINARNDWITLDNESMDTSANDDAGSDNSLINSGHSCRTVNDNVILKVKLKDFLKILDSDLNAVITECQKTTDIYEDNIEMLLKDILLYTADSDTNAIDCY